MAYDVKYKPVSATSTDLDDDGFVTTTETLEFTVTSDTPGVNATLVRQELQSLGLIPVEGDVHPNSGLAVARSVPLRQVSPIYYEGSINYRSSRRPSSDSDEDQSPWNLPAVYKFAGISSQVEIDSDVDGNAIVNPGTDEPVTGITRPVVDFGITIVKNILNLNPVAIQAFSNKVNNDTFLGFSPGLCKTGDLTADSQVHDGTTYYVVTLPIIVRDVFGGVTAEKAWWHRRVIKGYYELKAIDGVDKVVRALDEEKRPTSSPVLLDANGRRLATGASPVFIETKRHDTAAFNSFGIL